MILPDFVSSKNFSAMNKPQIRFKWFDDEWVAKSLSLPEFNIMAGGDVNKIELKTVGTYPVIANALSNEGILGYYDNYYRIKSPSISITGRGEVGVAVPRRKNFTPVVRLLALTSPNDIDFLSCAINKHPKILESTGVPQLTVPKLQSYNIHFPSHPEQSQIGTYFRQLDEIIAEVKREISRLEKMKQASLQKMFPRPGTTTPEIRFAGHIEPWISKKLSDSASFSRGHGYTKNDLREYGTPIFLYGRLYTKYSTYVDSVDTYSFIAPYSVISKGNEVIMPSSGETAEDIAVASAILSKGIILSGGLNIIIPNNDIDQIFLALSLTFSHAHSELAKKAQGKSIVHIYNQDIANLTISCPPTLSEQKAIGEYFRNLDTLISAKRQKLAKLRNIKQACLDMMFVNTSEL